MQPFIAMCEELYFETFMVMFMEFFKDLGVPGACPQAFNSRGHQCTFMHSEHRHIMKGCTGSMCALRRHPLCLFRMTVVAGVKADFLIVTPPWSVF
jgi:hypothetical protein